MHARDDRLRAFCSAEGRTRIQEVDMKRAILAAVTAAALAMTVAPTFAAMGGDRGREDHSAQSQNNNSSNSNSHNGCATGEYYYYRSCP
jgi:hypothetical protein